METFLDSPFLQALAAIWLGAGIVKGCYAASAIPTILGWWVFYKTNDPDQSAEWHKRTGLVICAGVMMVLAVILWGVVGPLLVFREGARKFFSPYGDPFLASVAANHLKMPTGVEPGEFETWDQYQTRIGDNPKEVAGAIIAVQPILPESIEKVIETSKRLDALQDREDIEVAEDEEFRDK